MLQYILKFMTLIYAAFHKLKQVISPAQIQCGREIDFTSGNKKAQCDFEKGFLWEKFVACFAIFHSDRKYIKADLTEISEEEMQAKRQLL